MISKEEIEDYKIKVINNRKKNAELISQSTTSLREQEILLEANNNINGALSIINRLENKQQKVIEKLEEEINTNNFRETECLEDKGRYYYAKEILEIMKGEE